MSLPQQAKLWSLAEDLAACFTGVTVTGYTDADAALRDAAMHALEPVPAVEEACAAGADRRHRRLRRPRPDRPVAGQRRPACLRIHDSQPPLPRTNPARPGRAARHLGRRPRPAATPPRDPDRPQAAITLIQDWVHGGDRAVRLRHGAPVRVREGRPGLDAAPGASRGPPDRHRLGAWPHRRPTQRGADSLGANSPVATPNAAGASPARTSPAERRPSPQPSPPNQLSTRPRPEPQQPRGNCP